MAKRTEAPVLDASHNYIKNAAGLTRHLCSSEPATRAAAITASLANVALAASDVTVGAGTSGDARRATVAAKSAVPITSAGTANHEALVSSTELLRVTTTASTVLGSGTVDMGTYYFEIGATA
jgi:hypothetical protein